MKPRFVIFGSMRTGSNYLVSLLNQVDGVVCHGEVFNPWKVGLREDFADRFGIQEKEIEKRDDNIEDFYNRMVTDCPDETTGFKIFPGHSAYALNKILESETCHRILLKRDILTSFISLRQAMESGVWVVGSGEDNDAKFQQRKTKKLKKYGRKIWFDPARYERYKKKVKAFHDRVIRDSARKQLPLFVIWYKDLQNLNKVGELLDFIGVDKREHHFEENIIKQTSKRLEERVENLGEMLEYLAREEPNRPMIRSASRRYCIHHGVVLDLAGKIISSAIKKHLREGRYESGEAAVLKQALEPTDRVLELGAGIGFIGILAKKIFPEGSVLSFEANPALIPRILRNQELNRCSIEVENAIVGRKNEKAFFQVLPNFWASKVVKTNTGNNIIEVAVQSYTEVLTRFRPNFLIVDIEGGEVELFEFLDLSGINKILIELHPGSDDERDVSSVVNTILEAGFLMETDNLEDRVLYFHRP